MPGLAEVRGKERREKGKQGDDGDKLQA